MNYFNAKHSRIFYQNIDFVHIVKISKVLKVGRVYLVTMRINMSAKNCNAILW